MELTGCGQASPSEREQFAGAMLGSFGAAVGFQMFAKILGVGAPETAEEAAARLVRETAAKEAAARAKALFIAFCTVVATVLVMCRRSTNPRPVAAATTAAGGTPLGRQQPVAEASMTMLPTTRWADIVPTGSCADALCGNAIRAACPQIDTIVSDCVSKMQELKWVSGLPAKLPEDAVVALAAYSHDHGAGREGNVYFELNNALRKRGKDDRDAMMAGWGIFMHYIMGAMAKLPQFQGVCYRGYPEKALAIAQYKPGRPVQWGAFSSTSTDFNATKSFTNQASGVIFKIQVTDGRDINAYSFFPAENEILLSPSHRFTVSSEPYKRDGFIVIDMVQNGGNTFIS
jgi:hypothetical protein